MSRLISETRLMWDMPITIAVVEPESLPVPTNATPAGADPVQTLPSASVELIDRVFEYFDYIDRKFSTFKPASEISRINRGELTVEQASLDMRVVFDLAEEMRRKTRGYFNIHRDGKIDPLGLVKGWAISNSAGMLRGAGLENFYVEAGGDFQSAGHNAHGEPWRVGVRNPFNTEEIVKVLSVNDQGVATSGTYIRGQHIDNPITGGQPDPDILSITVIGEDVYEADCYATAAFAMGRNGIRFIESLDGFEGYMIDRDHQAAYTSGFERYVNHAHH